MEHVWKGFTAGLLVLSLVLAAGPVAAEEAAFSPQSLEQGVFYAVSLDDVDMLAALRSKGANLDATLGETGLKAGDVFSGDAVTALLDSTADVETWTPLTWSVFLERRDILRVLIRSGAEVNSSDRNGAMPLHWAAWTGNYPIVNLLLANGANPSVYDHNRSSPMDWAVKAGQTDVARLLGSVTKSPPADEPDQDQDGVVDRLDQCPDTPIGAPVDDRGCWVAAYDSFFAFNQATLKRSYLPALRQTAMVLAKNPHIQVEIAGHTDNVGSEEYNLDLGRRRAEAVRNALVKYGVDGSRLLYQSYGESQPAADNGTASGRAKNRRVEIRIMER